MTANNIALNMQRELEYAVGFNAADADHYEVFRAMCLALRRELNDRGYETRRHRDKKQLKRVYYLSLEFLIGQSLINNAPNLGRRSGCGKALDSIGRKLDEIAVHEPDAALGNGGLGRLAACFIESMATLGIAGTGTGCGIRYDFGLFKQEIVDSQQREPLTTGTPKAHHGSSNAMVKRIRSWFTAISSTCRTPAVTTCRSGWAGNRGGVPYDMPIVGFGDKTVNALRLYAARSSESFDMQIFNSGDFIKVVEQKRRPATGRTRCTRPRR